jgi:hypothetical protein
MKQKVLINAKMTRDHTDPEGTAYSIACAVVECQFEKSGGYDAVFSLYSRANGKLPIFLVINKLNE